MSEAIYRIIQISDYCFSVEKLVRTWRAPIWPWNKGYWAEHWKSGNYPAPMRPFRSVAEAQKWIDDKRKYPIVVKNPA